MGWRQSSKEMRTFPALRKHGGGVGVGTQTTGVARKPNTYIQNKERDAASGFWTPCLNTNPETTELIPGVISTTGLGWVSLRGSELGHVLLLILEEHLLAPCTSCKIVVAAAEATPQGQVWKQFYGILAAGVRAGH